MHLNLPVTNLNKQKHQRRDTLQRNAWGTMLSADPRSMASWGDAVPAAPLGGAARLSLYQALYRGVFFKVQWGRVDAVADAAGLGAIIKDVT